ncbi:MAG: hypothetical protein E7661_03165 [Ruminococcaceae bacterium]|nr:hypothetical protein [Oscillospiraceae bacterium]
MNDVILRPYSPSDREAYVAIYEEAFPPSERKPFDFMLSPPANDHYKLLTVSTSSGAVAGLVILAYAPSGGEKFALLDYLAIPPHMRGSGIGHAILPLVRDHCHGQNARMFLEIEAPDPCAENAEQRLRRKDFYKSCGLCECGVKAWMYGTVMELLAYPEDAEHLTLDIYQDVVRACYPLEMGIPELINT